MAESTTKTITRGIYGTSLELEAEIKILLAEKEKLKVERADSYSETRDPALRKQGADENVLSTKISKM